MKIYDDIQFPDRTILEVTFLNKSDFYDISLQNHSYTIVGGDKDIPTNLVGIADDDKVYYITTDDKKLCYISSDIRTFIKQLLLFDDYTNNSILPDNPDEIQLTEYTDNLRLKFLELDKSAFKSSDTFWSEICEEVEYGIII
ncbi:MAG: SUKH-4 family immunity protein [Ruminococcus flavefaciens]|nr:SUKH-4 family immunity protein [Ruminococcus flavefaciens]